MEEEWLPIKDFPNYIVSNLGRVKRIARKNVRGHNLKEKFLNPWFDKDGYQRVEIFNNIRKNTSVHRIVAEAFVPNPNRFPEIDHIDTKKVNNIYTNLEWVTHKENLKRATSLGLLPHFKNSNGRFKGKISIYDKAGNLIDSVCGKTEMTQKGYCSQNVYACVNGKKKTHKGLIFKRL